MKKTSTRTPVIQSFISAAVLAFFVLLATGSYELYSLLDIDVQKFVLEGGLIEEQETHNSNGQVITTKGEQDDQGRWHGWVDIRYYKENGTSMIYQERVYMIHGRRNGISTRTYPDGTVKEDHYLGGVKVSGKKSALADGSAFDLLHARHPWYLYMMEAFTFDSVYVQQFLDTLETVLNTFEFEPADFDDFYEQAMDSVGTTPYDSIIQSQNTLVGSIGAKRMKDDQLRQAVVTRYRTGAGTTYEVVQATYPNYIKKMNGQGVSAGDFEVFCNALDDSLSLFTSPDPETPFYVDSVEARFYPALFSFSGSNGLKSSPAPGAYADLVHARELLRRYLRELRPSGAAATPEEVGEVAIDGILQRLLEGDIFRQSVRDAYMARQGLPQVPLAGTGFGSDISATSVSLNGHVMDDGGSTVLARGIAWAPYFNPTVDDQIEASGTGTGPFSVTIDGLTEGDTYYARTYATNSAGTAYGNVISFTAGSTVGIGDRSRSEGKLTFYPNPAASHVTLRFPTGGEGLLPDGRSSGRTGTQPTLEWALYDAAGKLVRMDILDQQSVSEGEAFVDLSGIPGGLYHIRIAADQVPVAAGQLVVVK